MTDVSAEARARSSAGPAFIPLDRCWVCDDTHLRRLHQYRFDFTEYADQDPPLASYTGALGWIRRCDRCGFGQPEALPALPNFFQRMYDQRWSDEWIVQEFESESKTLIFDDILSALAARIPPERRSLLDVGAHVGRFLDCAVQAGWHTEGVELNPRTAAFAARRTGLVVHREDLREPAFDARRFSAVTLIDVLEHVPDPVRLLGTLRTVLEPGGWLAVKVPHAPYQLLKERGRAAISRRYRATVADNLVHVNHFGPRSLRLALARAGYAEVTVRAAAPVLSGGPTRTLRQWADDGIRVGLYRLSRVIPGSHHLPLTFNLQAYARRG